MKKSIKIRPNGKRKEPLWSEVSKHAKGHTPSPNAQYRRKLAQKTAARSRKQNERSARAQRTRRNKRHGANRRKG